VKLVEEIAAHEELTNCPILGKSVIDFKDTPSKHGDIAMYNGKSLVLNQHFYVGWGEDVQDQDHLEPALHTMARMVEQYLATQVHRLPLYKDVLSPLSLDRSLTRLKEKGVEFPHLFLTPWSENEYYIDKEYKRDVPVTMSVGLPSIQEAVLTPVRAIENTEGKFYLDLEVAAGGPIQVGQTVEVNGRTYLVMSEPYPANEDMQRVHVDQMVFNVKSGDVARVGGIGEYNLLLGDNVFTIVSRPEVDHEGFTLPGGLHYNFYLNENGHRVLSLLFGLQITNPHHALVLEG
jgi:hypothetical protein